MEAPVSVLMVEDHPVYRDGLASAIERRDDLILIRTVTSAAEALEALRGAGADVVLLDIALPDGSGIARLHDLLEAGASCVLVLSANTDGETVRAALASGAAGFIAKDADRDEICDAIATVARTGAYLWPPLQATLVDELRRTDGSPTVHLSDRERQVLVLIAEGLSYHEIGRRIYVSSGTVKTYATRAFEKLGVSGQAAAVAEAIRRGLIE
jgi:two-component system nitrate/nitrite response regulator NarL